MLGLFRYFIPLNEYPIFRTFSDVNYFLRLYFGESEQIERTTIEPIATEPFIFEGLASRYVEALVPFPIYLWTI